MSQQPPPYGSPEQPPQQPYTPYSQGAYPNPYAQAPQRPNHTTRNVLLIVGVVVLLFCGGLVTLGFLAVNGVVESVEDGFDDEYVGSESDPLLIEEGEAFTIRGFDYEAGWSFTQGASFGEAITGLRATNMREDEESERASLVFTLLTDNEIVDQVTCYGSADVSFERSVTLDCGSTSEAPPTFDELEVYDTSFYE